MEKMERNITVIPAKQVAIKCRGIEAVEKKIRMAAYCRVSTDQDEQLNSFENQVEYYTRYISDNPKYELAGIYADEGISGTNTKKRKDFKRMIEDCEKGLIDMIIVKSISRFARNTQDCLMYSRKLKNLGIGIIFEKENINTLDATGELLFTILSSLAQDESRNISENCKWGIRSKFQKGIPHINTYKFMGFDKNKEGRLVVNKKEAEVVKTVFKLYLEGYGTPDIANYLNEQGIPGVSGEVKWIRSTIVGMLTQEKYMGDSILQKYYTADFLTHSLRKNTGQVDQYYVKNSHDAILDKETWEAAQEEMERRREYCAQYHLQAYTYRTPTNPFGGRIVCAKCGYTYARKSWRARGVCYWSCKSGICDGNIKETVFHQVFMTAWNHLVKNREKHMEEWKTKTDSPLMNVRRKQMIELTAEGPITTVIFEHVIMVLERMEVHSSEHFTVHFMDGSSHEVLV